MSDALSDLISSATAAAATVSIVHCRQLLKSLSQLVHSFLYHGHDSREGVFSLFPSDFHSSLRSLLTKLLLSHLAEWRETLLQGAVGPAKLVDFGKGTHSDMGMDMGLRRICTEACVRLNARLISASLGPFLLCCADWRVDVKSASNHLSHMAVPTVLVDMKVRERNRGHCTCRDAIASRCDSHVSLNCLCSLFTSLLTLVHRCCCRFAAYLHFDSSCNLLRPRRA